MKNPSFSIVRTIKRWKSEILRKVWEWEEVDSSHNTYLLSTHLEKIGIMIRKWDFNKKGNHINPSKKNLKRQILTLHRKLKKGDKVYTEYSIEKDKEGNKNHINIILHYTDKEYLYQNLSRFIGDGKWKKREIGLDVFDECNGKYGMIHTEPIVDEWKYRGYINKNETSTTLI